MARYSALLRQRIQVTYRAGDIVLPATGNLAADSGKSIFLEESYHQKGSVKTFRWEIPYQYIVRMEEPGKPETVVTPNPDGPSPFHYPAPEVTGQLLAKVPS